VFNSGYRRALAGHLSGLPAAVATKARQAPALALDAAHHLGPAGNSLATTTRHAFTSGMHFSMLFGAALLMLAAAFVAARGPARGEEFVEDALDELAPAVSLEPVSV
jgi:hypothetical protein